MKNFADSLRELSASYFAYHRMWDDLDAPGPRGVRLKPDYYKCRAGSCHRLGT